MPASARRIFVVDTTQADVVRQATTAPSISGTPAVGQTLTGDKGVWTLEPNTYTYEWLRNGTPIPNATGTTYTPSTADAGAQIKFRVTASGIGGPNVVSADSAPVPVTGAGGEPERRPARRRDAHDAGDPALTVSGKAKLTGAARVGKRLKLKVPTFAQSGVKLSIRWLANGKPIKKQTKSSLKLTQAARASASASRSR